MRQAESKTGVRPVRLMAIAAAVAVASFAGAVAPAQAYSGSQAEAQSDPTSDPYDFPNITLCCKKKPKRGGHGGGHGGGYGDPIYPRPGNGKPLYVSCGVPRPYTFDSVGAALEHLQQVRSRGHEGGPILVHADTPCNVSGLSIDQGVEIGTAYGSYGASPAKLVADACVRVGPSYPGAVVSFRGIDIDGCIQSRSGRLDLSQVNVSSYGHGDAISIEGGMFSSTDSTVRARGSALRVNRSVMVSLTRGAIASAAGAEQTMLLNAEGATITGTLIKGGKNGVRIDMQGRYGVTLKDVQIMRGDYSEIMQVGAGQRGVYLAGGSASDGLPSLPNMPGSMFTMEGGSVSGYFEGVDLAGGSRSRVSKVTIAHAKRGIIVGRGAYTELTDNRIMNSKYRGIDISAGASGRADNNTVQCDNGECVCYDGYCSSRSDYTFNPLFKMTYTRCDD